ncbi:hypothetical protein ACPV3O_21360 [Vibrio rotiferianus]|uniref:hypothetical protein n=1 Tax=Vibrio TaxID=662 RepID=UPI00168073FD|nr:hypothetical protein [Vibrio sp. S9_S30]MBD1559863.1 hypothetical protein [Vibrio sp. S9_S30]MCU8247229.1 hypothetical protein [Vibrio vulnificus]
MKKISSQMKENWLETIRCVVSSPKVHRFNVGITVDVDQRAKQYKYFSPSWPHLVVLKSGMDATLALEAEKFLFDELTQNKNAVTYKKYRNDTRDGHHVPSTGGLKSNREYSVYIAWGTKESYEASS